MTNQEIPPETIKVGVLHEEIPNPMREYYNQGVTQGVAFAIAKFKEILERTMEETTLPEPLPEPQNQTVVQAGAELVDNAIHDLLNHGCAESYSDYLTLGMIEKWLSSGKGSKYLAALVNAVLEAR